MGQLTIYLDDETEQLVRRHVEGSRMSASKWIAETVRNRVLSQWPDDVISLFGSWKKDDFPDAAELRAASGTDAKREEF